MRPPEILASSDFDPALAWTISVSLVLHALAIILVLVVPEEFLRRSPPLVSYTVDLTAGSELGGTNLGGSGGAKKGAPAPAAPAKAAAKPAAGPPPAKEALKQPAPPAPKVEPPKAEKVPEPPKAEKPPEPVKVEPKVEPPKPVEKAVALEKPKLPPKPEKPPEVAKAVQPPPKAVAPPVEKPKPPLAEKKAEPKPAPPQQAKAVAAKPDAEPAKSGAPVNSAKPTPAAKAEGGDDAGKRDQAIAAAVRRRAEAVKQDGGAGAPGAGGSTGSGPASIGPGVGSGGITKGIEWVMYVRQLEAKVKANWVWTVRDGARVAEVWFQILPTGEIVNAKISKSSGDPSFDASAERAVSGSNPLTPPPERYRTEFGSDGVLFTFNEAESRF